MGMEEPRRSELLQLGREAVAQAPGAAAVEQIEVEAGPDSSNEPAYRFTFLVNRISDEVKPIELYLNVIQYIRNELLSRNDEHYPYIRMLNQNDWLRRAGA